MTLQIDLDELIKRVEAELESDLNKYDGLKRINPQLILGMDLGAKSAISYLRKACAGLNKNAGSN